jgi:protein-L-isoaspartate O-methyltransferase
MQWDKARHRELAGTLAAYLTGQGVIDVRRPDGRLWATVLQEVPRYLFVPEQAYAVAYAMGESSRAIDRKAAAADWWRAAYTDCSIITQRDDGRSALDDTMATPTCSLSCPSAAVQFLDLLELDDHHRVLEIGTGTGWTAAVLAWRLRGQQVVTVEVDASLSGIATCNAVAAGFSPTFVIGDGALGHADRAPYDRVHVTCGVRDIPYAWIEQTRPGGTIALPYIPAMTAEQGGQRLLLTVLDDGSAVGRFQGPASYMMLRAQRRRPPREPHEPGRTRYTRFDPRTLVESSGRHDGAMLMLAALLPDVVSSIGREHVDRTWIHSVHVRDLGGDSWATCRTRPGSAEADVVQYGARNLWDEVENAYMAWLRAGRPGRDRVGITVTERGRHFWLDTPDQPVGRAVQSLET